MYLQVQKQQGHREPEPQGNCCPQPGPAFQGCSFLRAEYVFCLFSNRKTIG